MHRSWRCHIGFHPDGMQAIPGERIRQAGSRRSVQVSDDHPGAGFRQGAAEFSTQQASAPVTTATRPVSSNLCN